MASFPLSDETHGGEDVSVYAIGPQVTPRVLPFNPDQCSQSNHLSAGPSGDRGA